MSDADVSSYPTSMNLVQLKHPSNQWTLLRNGTDWNGVSHLGGRPLISHRFAWNDVRHLNIHWRCGRLPDHNGHQTTTAWTAWNVKKKESTIFHQHTDEIKLVYWSVLIGRDNFTTGTSMCLFYLSKLSRTCSTSLTDLFVKLYLTVITNIELISTLTVSNGGINGASVSKYHRHRRDQQPRWRSISSRIPNGLGIASCDTLSKIITKREMVV